MKKGIHPKYEEARVICSCGETFVTRSTKPDLRVEICSKCHPFFTGKQKFVDSGGRVERFQKKYGRLDKDKKKTFRKKTAAAKTREKTEARHPAMQLQPILTWKSRIISLKGIPQNSFVGYSRAFQTNRPTQVAIIPVTRFKKITGVIKGMVIFQSFFKALAPSIVAAS